MARQRVAVLFGGRSNEHDISLISAAFIIDSIPKDKYETVAVGITEKGHWLHYIGDTEAIRSGEWENSPDNVPCVLSPDPLDRGFIATLPDGDIQRIRVDCIFPALHGKNGEDGTIQGLFQLSQIPFVGCDMLSSACCMDKETTHRILESCGIRMARWASVRADQLDSIEKRCLEIAEILEFPMFIKPSRAGSSVGVSKAYSMAELKEGIKNAFTHDSRVIVEQGVEGVECECAVMGNGGELIVSTVGEIAPANEFYDFESKYTVADEQTYIPARFPSEKIERIRETAEKAYRAIGCEGLSRVDFFLEDGGDVVLNEINTMPGHTPISMYPKLMEYGGMSASEEMDRLITLAIERDER